MNNQNKPLYTLDETAQQHLNDGLRALWQAYAMIELIQRTLTADEMADYYAALDGVKTLFSKGLDDLGEV